MAEEESQQVEVVHIEKYKGAMEALCGARWEPPMGSPSVEICEQCSKIADSENKDAIESTPVLKPAEEVQPQTPSKFPSDV